MKLSKKKITAITVGVLVCVAGILIVSSRKGTFNEKESAFAVPDTAAITKIFMVDKQNAQITLARQTDGSWLLNNTYVANPEIVTGLLKTMANLAVRFPVSDAAHDNIIKRMAIHSTKVEIYAVAPRINLFGLHLFNKERCIKTYYVGDASMDNLGNFMLIEGADRSFVVHEPGFRGFVSARYATDEDVWRSHKIFDYKVSDIKSIKHLNLEHPEESFTIAHPDVKTFELYDKDGTRVVRFDTMSVVNYACAFRNINFESFAHLSEGLKDTTRQNFHFHTIEITLTNGEVQTVNLYKCTDYAKEILHEIQGIGFSYGFDVDRMYATIGKNDDEFVFAQYFVFDRLLIGLSDLVHGVKPNVIGTVTPLD